MKQLICEMCGSADLLKQDGVFVCQSCGCKYSVEDAKKMMVEGTVEVTGTVKVDNRTHLENLYQIARRARDNEDDENAAKYYEMILVEEPDSWEATFYSVYHRAKACKIAHILTAASNLSNCLGSVFMLISKQVPAHKQKAATEEVLYRTKALAYLLANGAVRHFKEIDPSIRKNYRSECLERIDAASNAMYICGNEIEQAFLPGDDFSALAISAWKETIELRKLKVNVYGMPLKIIEEEQLKERIKEKIAKHDIDFAQKYARSQQLQKEINELSQKHDDMSGPVVLSGVFSMICLVFGPIFMLLTFSDSLAVEPLASALLGLLMVLAGLVLLKTYKKEKEKISPIDSELEAKKRELNSLGKL